MNDWSDKAEKAEETENVRCRSNEVCRWGEVMFVDSGRYGDGAIASVDDDGEYYDGGGDCECPCQDVGSRHDDSIVGGVGNRRGKKGKRKRKKKRKSGGRTMLT